jgi:DNA repair ATPase RecN
MTSIDLDPKFTNAFDACLSAVRNGLTVVSLRPDLSRLERRIAALHQLEAALDTLEMTKDEPQDDYQRFHSAERRLSHLTQGQRMKRNFMHLCGIFGRPT